MKNICKYILCLGIAGITGIGDGLHAQETIDKEIVVVKPYQPSLSDAFKINVQPRVSDSISIRPSFDYSIQPKKFDTRFQVRPINAARMVGTPLTKLYKSYLKLGIGTYLDPFLELNINSLRDKSRQWGIDLKHYSINGKLKLDNDKKVNSGYFDNSLSIYGKKIFRKHYLSGKIGGAFDGTNFYGYHPSFTDTTLQKEDIRQNWLKLDGRMKMGTIHKDSLHLNWMGILDYYYTYDHYKNAEHAIELKAEFNERFRSGRIYGLKVAGAYYYTTDSIDPSNNVVVSLNPWFGKTTSEYIYRLGVGLVLDVHGDKTKPYFHPQAMLQINMVDGILIPYFGVDGNLKVNNYRTVAEINRYVAPGLKVENTNHKIRGYAGLKGSITKTISYQLDASYSLVDKMPLFFNVDKMPLFLNDTIGIDSLANTFRVAYDDMEWVRIHGEVEYRRSERFRALLTVTYNHYRMETLEKPWHHPNLLVQADAEYNLHNKILVDLGIYYMGKRYAPGTLLDMKEGTELITLDGFVDLNLGFEYRYTKNLSGFIRINNILGSRIYTWNQYPGMGFNVQFGFTYAL